MRSSTLSSFILSLSLALAVSLLVGTFSLRRDEYFFFQIILSSKKAGVAQLFFDTGHGYNPHDSINEAVAGEDIAEELRFTIPVTVYGLRLDPINFESDVILSDACIVDANGQVLHRFSPIDFTAGKDMILSRHDNIVEMKCVEGGNDPYLFITPPPNPVVNFAFSDWLWKIAPKGLAFFFLLTGLVLASSRCNQAQLQTLSQHLHARPFVTMAVFSVFGTLIQFHPLFFSPADIPGPPPGVLPHGGLLDYFGGLSTLQSGEKRILSFSSLISTDLFSILSQIFQGISVAQQLSIFAALWVFVFGCTVLAWLLTRSLSVGALICGCAVFTSVWPSEILPSFPPAIAFAPWIIVGWLSIARSIVLRDLILSCVFVVFLNLQLANAEQSTRIAFLSISANITGVIIVALQTKPRRNLTLAAALLTVPTVCLIAGSRLWPFIYSIPRSSAKAEAASLHLIPADIAVSFFDSFFLREVGGFGIPPSANLVVYSGVVWALVRASELWSKPAFIGTVTVTAPMVILASGILPDNSVPGWLKTDSAAMLQQASWYSLVLYSLLLAIFGFGGLRRIFVSSDAKIYLVKASVFFFSPFAFYLGTFQQYTSYSFKSAYVISIIIAWIVGHLALMREPSSLGRGPSTALICGTLLLSWWHYSPYAHYFLPNILSAK